MTPKPSHPNSKIIVLVSIIKNIIDITNNRTSIINRSVVLSFLMYVLANCITLVAMVKTVDIKIMPAESIIIGTVI